MVMRDNPVSWIICLMRRNFMLVLPVTCRCAVSAHPAHSSAIIRSAPAESHQGVLDFCPEILRFFCVLITPPDPQYSEEFPALAMDSRPGATSTPYRPGFHVMPGQGSKVSPAITSSPA